MASLSRLEIDIRLKRYPGVGEAPAHVALGEVRMSLGQGEFICVLGPSGCGKTTMLNIVAGLDGDFEGEIALPAAPGRAAPVLGYVFQTPRLLPWRTVIENIHLVLSPEQIASGIADELLAATGLQDFRHAYPERLSLGMSRRVALARAFAVQPDLLLMDEPFASLDEPTARKLRRLLLQVWGARPTTVLFVTHDLREAVQLAHRIVLFSPAPATVQAEMAVELSPEARGDDAEVEAFRARLIRDNPTLYGEL